MANNLDDVTEKEWCPACGNHHEIVDGQSVVPTLCHNLTILVRAVREMVEQGDEDSAAALAEVCDEILGEETVDEDEDDDSEVFN